MAARHPPRGAGHHRGRACWRRAAAGGSSSPGAAGATRWPCTQPSTVERVMAPGGGGYDLLTPTPDSMVNRWRFKRGADMGQSLHTVVRSPAPRPTATHRHRQPTPTRTMSRGGVERRIEGTAVAVTPCFHQNVGPRPRHRGVRVNLWSTPAAATPTRCRWEPWCWSPPTVFACWRAALLRRRPPPALAASGAVQLQLLQHAIATLVRRHRLAPDVEPTSDQLDPEYARRPPGNWARGAKDRTLRNRHRTPSARPPPRVTGAV